MRNILVLIGTYMFCCAAAQAADCNDGQAAVLAGNYAKAVSIFEPLAQQGDSCAQNRLGDLYKLGLGVHTDKAKALVLYEAAAAQGNPEAKIQAEFLRSSK